MKGPARTCHTATFKGKRVFVRLIDGTSFVDRFEDRTKRFVMFRERGKVSKAVIKSFSDYKQQG